MTTFRYLSVDDWGGTWARPPVSEKQLDGVCMVHHTAGGTIDNDAGRAFRALNEYAQNVKGYSFLDYDVLIHRSPLDGMITIGEGRGKWLSAATLDFNEQSEAVCVLGYFHPGHALTRKPHPDELEGLALGIVWGINNGWLSPDCEILGHRDNPQHPGATGCPGDLLYEKLPWVRERVAQMLNPPPPVPEEDEIMLMWRHTKYADVFIVGSGACHVNPTVKKALDAKGVDLIVEADDAMLGYVCDAAGFDKAKLTKL